MNQCYNLILQENQVILRITITWTEVNCVGPPSGNDENWLRARVILLKLVRLDKRPSFYKFRLLKLLKLDKKS